MARLRLWSATSVVALLLALAAPALAVQPDEILPDAKLEARARALSAELRCLVCQNQSIDDSNAPLARDLRLLVRERLTSGDSDEAVMRFVVQRYGDFVLLRPPVKPSTWLLWLGPLALLLATIYFLMSRLRSAGRGHADQAAPLSSDEQARLKSLLADRKSEG